MASRPFPLVPTWLIFCVTAVLATNLSNDFSRLIPSCAEECFASFLNVNYAPDSCTGRPLLDCLCSRRGASGFTLGEGAMQCISAERSIGFCSILEANDRVIENAYDMCRGKPNAVHPTHLTITATLVLAPSGGVVTFPSVMTTRTRTTSSSDTSSTIRTLPTTLVIDTSSPPVIPRPSTKTTIRSTTRSTTGEQPSTDSSDDATTDSEIISITEPPITRSTTFKTSTSVTTSETETTSSTGVVGGAGGASKDEDNDEPDNLSTEQVAGISVGVLAAVGVAVGAIVLARYYRRRKYPHIKTGFLPMRDTWGYKPARSDNGGHNSWMVHQLRPDLDPTNNPPPPPAYNRRSIKPEAIGVALSPPPSNRNTAHSSPLRRLSKLLPAKPTLPDLSNGATNEKPLPLLKPEWGETGRQVAGPPGGNENPQIPPPTLAVPIVASPPRSRPMAPVPPKLYIPPAETSAAAISGTNNRESNVTEFEEDRTSISPNANTQVWRPPPTTPLSATTYYVADQYGNWVLGNPKRASVVARGSQDSKGSQEGASKPAPKYDNGPLGSAEPNNARTLAPAAEIVPAGSQFRPGGPRPQYPSPFFSSQQSHPRRSASSRRSMTRPLTRPREDSSSSSTTIITTSTDSSSSIPSLALEQQVSLSPVVESPQSVRNRQQQPKIPPRDPRRASQMGSSSESVNMRSAPPTRQIVYSPPGQPSPTLGMMQPPTGDYPALRPQPQTAPQNTEPIANAGLETTSPTMRIVDPSPEPEETGEPSVVNPTQIRASPYYFDPPYPEPLQTRQPSQHRRSASGPQPQQYQPYQRPPSFQPSPRQQQAAWQPVQRLHAHHHQQQRQHQQPQQQNAWQPTQRMPPSYQSFQQQQPLQPYQRQQQYQQSYQQPPQMYPSFQARHSQQLHPRTQGGYQSYQQYPAQQQPQIHPSMYQSYRPPQPTNPPLAQSGSQDSLLAKRVGSGRAADMTIGTDQSKAPKWNRDDQNKTPPNFPLSPHWKPTLTPTRRGDDLYLNVQ
ncbi:hypothetical protein DER45DRAFT_532139 [Fusarium avenaceum]|nr:hypothetical protein DER45DRAFT_532139 [Fusarium avenaceum]